MTKPIEHFIVRFSDGTVKKVVVGEGNGFFREEEFVGTKESFTTYQCFVAKGSSREIPSSKG
jgi:hypothetical protein